MKKIKTGIILLNMGGPKTVHNVQEYLQRIMADRNMIEFPLMQEYLGSIIAKRRTLEVQKKYEAIGGGSSILKWTQKQGELLCKNMDEISPATSPHKYYIAFRYVQPFTKEAFEELESDGVQRAIIFSQYPQYSCSTSGSSFNEIYKFFEHRDLPKGLKLSVIDRWATNKLYVKTIATLLRNELNKLPNNNENTIILFSAHSLPLKAVNRGDSYPTEIGATVELVMQELGYCYPYQLVWQSKVGPLPWLGPFTGNAIKEYVKQGTKRFILVPIAFVNEHIETLHEMDIEYCKDLAHQIGIEYIKRVQTPNDHPLFIEALSDVVKSHIDNNIPYSPKFLHRCPHCTNSNCLSSKLWFSKVCKP